MGRLGAEGHRAGALCLCLPTGLTPPAPCRWLLWIFPFLVKSHQVGFPSRVTFLAAQRGAQQSALCPGRWQQSGRPCSTALGCPRPCRGLKVTVGQGELRGCCCLLPDPPPGRRSGVVRTCLEIQQQVVPARMREMSSCGSSTLRIRRGKMGSAVPPSPAANLGGQGTFPRGSVPRTWLVFDCRIWVPASLPSPLNLMP